MNLEEQQKRWSNMQHAMKHISWRDVHVAAADAIMLINVSEIIFGQYFITYILDSTRYQFINVCQNTLIEFLFHRGELCVCRGLETET